MQLAHPKLVEQKLGAFRPRICHYSIPYTTRMPEGPAKRPGKYCYVSITIQRNISHLFTQSWIVKELYMCNTSIKHSSFVSPQFKCQTVLFTPWMEPHQKLQIRARVNLGAMAMKEYPTFPKTQRMEPHHRIA